MLLLTRASEATPAGFLPHPGVVINGNSAMWIEPAGRYMLDIEPELVGLTMEQVAALLRAEGPWELGPYPPGTMTGVHRVDTVVAAALAGDAGTLHDLLQFVERPCSIRGGIGGTDCPEGAEEGDLVGSVIVSSCEGNGATDIPIERLADFLTSTKFLVAVARTDTPDEQFVAVFAKTKYGAEPLELGIGDSGVTHFHFGCAESAPAMTARWDDFILPLRLETPPGPPATGSGLSARDTDGPLLRLPLLASLVAVAFAAAAMTAYQARSRPTGEIAMTAPLAVDP